MEEKQMAKELFFSVIVRTENMYGTGGVMFSANKYKDNTNISNECRKIYTRDIKNC